MERCRLAGCNREANGDIGELTLRINRCETLAWNYSFCNFVY